jgi:TonB family protein
MGEAMRRLSLGTAACLVGLALVSGTAWAGGTTVIPAKIDKNAGPVQLKYPKDAQRNGEAGSIDFALYLTASGRPTGKIRILKSTGFKDLDNAAIDSALNWRYVPAQTTDGDTQSSWITLHLEYKLPRAKAQSAKSDS